MRCGSILVSRPSMASGTFESGKKSAGRRACARKTKLNVPSEGSSPKPMVKLYLLARADIKALFLPCGIAGARAVDPTRRYFPNS